MLDDSVVSLEGWLDLDGAVVQTQLLLGLSVTPASDFRFLSHLLLVVLVARSSLVVFCFFPFFFFLLKTFFFF